MISYFKRLYQLCKAWCKATYHVDDQPITSLLVREHEIVIQQQAKVNLYTGKQTKRYKVSYIGCTCGEHFYGTLTTKEECEKNLMFWDERHL